jgi:rhamnogalacturonyl hydrolase YesR
MMKPAFLFLVLTQFLFCTQFSFGADKNTSFDFIRENVGLAVQQYDGQINLIEKSGKVLNPKTCIKGKIVYIPNDDWTSGFFSGDLWYLYELTGDKKWKMQAIKYTEALDSVQYLTDHHDIGFMIGCSYGNGYKLTHNKAYERVIIQAAKSLSTRFRPVAGVIQSWNVRGNWQEKKGWQCPVIIDNMMNLELLFRATSLSGDSSFYRIAVSHADQTMKNHFRRDNSCWHVIDYSMADGSVKHRQTAQGYSDESAWARGQAWAIYGFTMCYRETGNRKYLDQAEKTFEFVANHPNLPKDGVPYWDFNAPKIPREFRDVSSAAIIASALYELSTYDKSEYYKGWADKIMKSLGGKKYRAKPGKNGNFILMHSVGSIPHKSEVDVPLNYADYYFLEALKRKMELEE